MRIAVMSNIPGIGVGYGTLTKYLLPLFEKHHKVCLLCNYGIDGVKHIYLKEYPNIRFYGKGVGTFDEQVMIYNYAHFEADILLPIWDIWALNKIPTAALQKQLIMVSYLPIDSEKLSPDMRKSINACWKVITMSKHAEDLVKKEYPEKILPHIPGGVNSKIYKPQWDTLEEKRELRRKLGFNPDAFIIGLGGDIKGQRKSFAENLEGIKIFIQKNPQLKIGIYLHTMVHPPTMAEHNIQQIVSDLGLADITRTTEYVSYLRGYTEKEMAETYNGLDVFLQASRGEGFGLMFIEAQACGTPVIGTNFSSMPQVVGPNSGFLVNPAIIFADQAGGNKAVPSPSGIALGLENIYNAVRKDPLKIRDESRKFAMNFDWETKIYPQWVKTLKKIEEDLISACIRVVPPSDELIKNAKEIKVYG